MRRNLVYNQIGNGQDGAGISIDQWCKSNEISYNICYSNDGPGIYLFDADNCKIFNNTCYANCRNSSGQLNEKGEIRLTSSMIPNDFTSNAEVKNNIGYATHSGVYAIYVDSETSGNVIDISNNVWYRNDNEPWYFWKNSGGSDLSVWNNFIGAGKDFNMNPLFVSPNILDFRLLKTSPCIDEGMNLGLLKDYDDNPVPQGNGIDIGAFEYPRLAPPKDFSVY